jgi:hypothetical protein
MLTDEIKPTTSSSTPVSPLDDDPFARFRRYIPLLVWVVVITTCLLIPAKIIGYGFLPADDALRHAAKAVSGKDWSEIMLLRPGFEMDIHPGWHAILGALHRSQNFNAETLVVISIFGLMLLVNLSVLPWLRRPEAWIATLLAVALLIPIMIKRLALGRPYLFTIAVFLSLLLIWSRLDNRKPGLREIIASLLLIAAAAWIHSSWYLLALPAVPLVLCRRWRPAAWLVGCWAAGAFLGACLTGHPFQFLSQSYRLLSAVFGELVTARVLAVELLPSDGGPLLLLGAMGLLLWRARSPGWRAEELLDPIFLMGVMGWLLGLKVGRFWWDWGLPAVLLWMALTLQKQMTTYVTIDSLNRLLVCCALSAGLFFSATSDRESRWSWNLSKQYLSAEDPELAGWWPERDGIFYSADMAFFYENFYKNPKAPGRYVLGFEPTLMPPEDLAVVRKVQWNYGDVRAYEPWLQKLRPQDRLVLRASMLGAPGQPRIPQLEWHYANDLWIGRLPQKGAAR